MHVIYVPLELEMKNEYAFFFPICWVGGNGLVSLHHQTLFVLSFF